jgi:hypothetical protein
MKSVMKPESAATTRVNPITARFCLAWRCKERAHEMSLTDRVENDAGLHDSRVQGEGFGREMLLIGASL